MPIRRGWNIRAKATYFAAGYESESFYSNLLVWVLIKSFSILMSKHKNCYMSEPTNVNNWFQTVHLNCRNCRVERRFRIHNTLRDYVIKISGSCDPVLQTAENTASTSNSPLSCVCESNLSLP